MREHRVYSKNKKVIYYPENNDNMVFDKKGWTLVKYKDYMAQSVVFDNTDCILMESVDMDDVNGQKLFTGDAVKYRADKKDKEGIIVPGPGGFYIKSGNDKVLCSTVLSIEKTGEDPLELIT